MTALKTNSMPAPNGTPARTGQTQWTDACEVQANQKTGLTDRAGRRRAGQRGAQEGKGRREARAGKGGRDALPTGTQTEPTMANGRRDSGGAIPDGDFATARR